MKGEEEFKHKCLKIELAVTVIITAIVSIINFIQIKGGRLYDNK